MHHNLRRDIRMGRNIRVSDPLTARELAKMDAELDQVDMYGPQKMSEDHLEDLDLGGYSDASRCELQAGGERDGKEPATVQVTVFTPINRQILCSHAVQARRLSRPEMPVNYMGMPT